MNEEIQEEFEKLAVETYMRLLDIQEVAHNELKLKTAALSAAKWMYPFNQHNPTVVFWMRAATAAAEIDEDIYNLERDLFGLWIDE
jgi:hypothetical protein